MREELKRPDSPRVVYKVVDRRGVIYVGVTHDLQGRVKTHLNCKSSRIGSRLSDGGRFKIEIEEVVTYAEAKAAERRAIEKYASRRLLNLMCNKKGLMRERLRKHRETRTAANEVS